MRIYYPWGLFTSRAPEEGKPPKFGAVLVLEKTGDWSALLGAIKECVLGAWPGAGPERWKNGVIRDPILDGGGKSARDKETGAIKEGFGEHLNFIRVSANETHKPVVVDKRMALLTKEEDITFGSWGYPFLNAYAWNHPQNGDGITFGIEQFMLDEKAEGDKIIGGGGGGKRLPPAKAFEAVKGADGPAPAGGAASMFD
jgi:hypothetical protein